MMALQEFLKWQGAYYIATGRLIAPDGQIANEDLVAYQKGFARRRSVLAACKVGRAMYGIVAATKLAVWDERERCARIAEAHPGACQTGCDTGEEIAKRIREGLPDKPDEQGISVRFDRKGPPPGIRYEVIAIVPKKDKP